jgi:hypothetical protein
MATGSPAPHHHAVQFYGTDESLYSTVACFLGEGLVARQPAIVIATPEHRAAIVEHLSARMIDCKRAVREGNLIVLDAQATLDLFMVRDEPHPELFHNNVGRLIEQALDGRHGTTVRAYGEMVDVLWKQGRPDGAIKLEILWNTLALKYQFALLCGYAMGSFYKQMQQLEAVCAQHSHIVADARNVIEFPARATRTA